MCFGQITPKEGYTEVLFYKTAFDEMLRKGRYEDSSIVLKELKANGFLDCDADRYTRSRKNQNGIRQDVYVLKLDEQLLQDLTTNQQKQGDEDNE